MAMGKTPASEPIQTLDRKKILAPTVRAMALCRFLERKKWQTV